MLIYVVYLAVLQSSGDNTVFVSAEFRPHVLCNLPGAMANLKFRSMSLDRLILATGQTEHDRGSHAVFSGPLHLLPLLNLCLALWTAAHPSGEQLKENFIAPYRVKVF